jgi:hypothetical protein
MLFGCSQTQAPRAPSAGQLSHQPEYVTIAPEVSVSKTAEQAQLKQAALDPDEDVMAEILAIPPGR